MDLSELQSEIDQALADSAHLVLTTALDKIGPCTYAMYLPLYVKTKVHLTHLDRWWWQCGDGDVHRRPEPIHLERIVETRRRQLGEHGINPDNTMLVPEDYWGDTEATAGWKSSPSNYDCYRREIEERLIELHAKMYRQPCLLCETCQHRKKLWQNSPFSLLGTPLTPRSQALATRLSQR